MVRLILRYSCRIVAHSTKRVVICRCSSMKVDSAAGSEAFPPKMNVEPKAKQILDFWFGSGWETWSLTEYKSSLMSSWFGGSPELDEEIKKLFGDDCEALLRGDYDKWQMSGNTHNALAGIILGDQFFRNIYRGTSKMFAADPKVLPWAKEIIAAGKHTELVPLMRTFIFLPLMHSEELCDQELAAQLYDDEATKMKDVEGGEEMSKFFSMSRGYSERHKVIIEKYGRFPHRNLVLGRENTAEEERGLEDGSIEKF